MDMITVQLAEIAGVVIALAAVVITMYRLNTKAIQRLAKIEARVAIVYKWFAQHVIHRGDGGEP